MKTTILTALSVVGATAAHVVAVKLAPEGAPPAGCTTNFDGEFEISVSEGSSEKRGLSLEVRQASSHRAWDRPGKLPAEADGHSQKQKRAACSAEGILVVTLTDGTLRDAQGRTGYISSDFQLQFDEPPQENAIYTSGFSVCHDSGLLALGPSTQFFKCRSSEFWNLYDRHWAEQCSPVELTVMPCGGESKEGGQVVGTAVVATTIVITLSDGQTQVVTTQAPIPICQIGDGQVQAHTTPCELLGPGAPEPTNRGPPVGESSDGQIQLTGTAPPPPEESGATGGPPPAESSEAALPVASSGYANGTFPATTATVPPPVEGPTSAPGGGVPPPEASVPVSGGRRVEMGSVGAFVLGVLGAVWFL